MPFLIRFGVLHLEWQLCVYDIPCPFRKQYLVGLHGRSTQDIGVDNFPSTF